MGVRADKFIWVVRLAKTRSDAADAIKGGRVVVNGTQIKPSRDIEVGDTIGVKRMPAIFSFKVIALADKRVGAKLVPTLLQDTTPESEIAKLELARLSSVGERDRGMGRPTKRDRRELDEFLFGSEGDD